MAKGAQERKNATRKMILFDEKLPFSCAVQNWNNWAKCAQLLGICAEFLERKHCTKNWEAKNVGEFMKIEKQSLA